MLPSPRRRQILQDMGLPVWISRPHLSQIQNESRASTQAAANQPNNRLSDLSASLDASLAPSGRTQKPRAGKRAQPTAGPSAPGQGLALPAVQCTWLGSWMLLAAPSAQPGVRRFIRDLLWAAAGSTERPTQLLIEAGQLAAEVGSDQAQLALTAFVDKRLDAVQAKGLLLESSLGAWQQWLPLETPAGAAAPQYCAAGREACPVVVLPNLLELMNDGAAKLRCWRQLQVLQQSA